MTLNPAITATTNWPNVKMSFRRAPITRLLGATLYPTAQITLATMTPAPRPEASLGQQNPLMNRRARLDAMNSRQLQWALWPLLRASHCSQLNFWLQTPEPVSGYPPRGISWPVAFLWISPKLSLRNWWGKALALAPPAKMKPMTMMEKLMMAPVRRTSPYPAGMVSTAAWSHMLSDKIRFQLQIIAFSTLQLSQLSQLSTHIQ